MAPTHPATRVFTDPPTEAGFVVQGGELAPLLPRFSAAMQRIEDEQKLAKIVLETGDLPADEKHKRRLAKRSAEGDPRRLRGIPCIARGVGGTAPGTRPGFDLADDLEENRWARAA